MRPSLRMHVCLKRRIPLQVSADARHVFDSCPLWPHWKDRNLQGHHSKAIDLLLLTVSLLPSLSVSQIGLPRTAADIYRRRKCHWENEIKPSRRQQKHNEKERPPKVLVFCALTKLRRMFSALSENIWQGRAIILSELYKASLLDLTFYWKVLRVLQTAYATDSCWEGTEFPFFQLKCFELPLSNKQEQLQEQGTRCIWWVQVSQRLSHIWGVSSSFDCLWLNISC